jgi:hypothetical protein
MGKISSLGNGESVSKSIFVWECELKIGHPIEPLAAKMNGKPGKQRKKGK